VMDETLLICEDDKQRKYWISISEWSERKCAAWEKRQQF
jgi:hypothetical protein